MITIQDVLSPKHTLLEIKATTPQGAIYEVADLLRGDDRVSDWTGLYEGLKNVTSCFANNAGYGVCIPHARTRGVNAMVMAAGRSAEGILFEESAVRVHYFFVIGVPEALATDYLRIIGALARIIKSPDAEQSLRTATTRQEFRDLLVEAERH